MAAVVQSEHARKFDRQMRLWGAHGQQLLELAKIAVLGSGPTATETLKNLVLPNVGSFVIVDDVDVTAADCGNNFFVTQDDIGKKRAEVVREWLLEMNPDARGEALVKNPQAVIKDELAFFDQFNLVIATQVYGQSHQALAAYLYGKNIPYMNVRTNGLMGYMRIALKELAIMESHPTNDRTDLCLYPKQLANFPELQAYVDKYDIDSKDIEKHAHCPCLAILGQFTKRWVEKNGALPTAFKDQQEFKDAISEMGKEQNYDDAIHWAYQCYNEPRIDREVKEVLADPAGDTLSADSSDYWVLVRALKDFMGKEGAGYLPVSTNIPDLTMDSESYVELKKIFKARYERDRDLIGKYAAARLQEIGRDAASISAEILDRFVRNCRNLKVVRLRSVQAELDTPDKDELEEKYFDLAAMEREAAGDEKEAEEAPFSPMNVNWYWAFRACGAFLDKNGYLPGGKPDSDLAKEAAELVAIQQDMFKKIDFDQDVVPECLAEMARFGGAEVHNTAAMLGGIASQASLKILLRQFFPFSNTLIYNGINCSCEVINT